MNLEFGRMGRVTVALVLLGTAGLGLAQESKTTLALPPAPLLPPTLGKLARVADGDAGDGWVWWTRPMRRF